MSIPARPARLARGARAWGFVAGEHADASFAGQARRAGEYANGVSAKFRYGVVRSEQRVVLNFDLTPFA